MVFRLLYRLFLQSLNRDSAAESPESATTGGRAKETAAPFRRVSAPVAFVLFVAALSAVAISVLFPTLQKRTGDASSVLILSIPEVDAKPLIVYLYGTGLDPPRPQRDSSPVHRIRSVNGRFSPWFQVVPYAGTMEMVNVDAVAHNTHVFNRGETVFNVALPIQGVRVRKVLTGTGIFKIRCDMHPWMKAWLFVSPSQHYAVVHDPTTISFSDIDPGEYTLHVWQPDRGESVLLLDLEAGETRRMRLG